MSNYFNDITKIQDFDIDNILLVDKLYENILIYDTSYKTLLGVKPLSIMFKKVDGFIRGYECHKSLLSKFIIKTYSNSDLPLFTNINFA